MNSATSSDKEAELQKPSKSAARLKLAREWHLYLRTLFAPSILFFALTGALQLFGLHEGHPGEVGRQTEEHVTNKPTLALKCFFLAMAVGLVFSTLLGIYMAFKYNRSRALVWSMLLIGTAIPAGLLAMMG